MACQTKRDVDRHPIVKDSRVVRRGNSKLEGTIVRAKPIYDYGPWTDVLWDCGHQTHEPMARLRWVGGK